MEVSDLGVLIDSRITLSSHISQITSKAMQMLGFVQRSSYDFSILTFRRLYCSLVRSILEYCSVVWSSLYHCYIDQIERVQNKFVRQQILVRVIGERIMSMSGSELA